jgi:hypothetical protein
MDISYSASQGIAQPVKPGSNRGGVTSFGVSYNQSYELAETRITATGTHGQNQHVIDQLTAQGLSKPRLTILEQGEHTDTISLAFKQPPREVITALKGAGMINDQSRWELDRFLTDVQAQVGMKRELDRFRSRRSEAAAPAANAEAAATPPIRRAM